MSVKRNYLEDTIVAISTPISVGGLGIVRLSGDKSIQIASKIFVPRNKRKEIKKIKNFTVTLGYIVNEKEVVDEVLMTLMRAPKSYTCEDVVEFSCHGGIAILKSIIELCIKHGARLADHGEFTKRAFLNGRIDLSQAESVAQIINAKTVLQSRLATKSLLGITKKNVEQIVENLKIIIAEVEVVIDYPEYENIINDKEIKDKTKKIIYELNEALENSKKLSPLITGLNIAIVGKPNVGKSSLLNILLNHDRAIVSDIPGTTRDIISETIILRDVPVRIIDTAGIRMHSQDVIEKIGMEKTKKVIEEAEIILFMLDAKEKLNKEDFQVAKIISEASKQNQKKVILLVNKTDLDPQFDIDNLKNLKVRLGSNTNVINTIKISCKTKNGIKEVENEIVSFKWFDNSLLDKLLLQESDTEFVLTNLRQMELVKNAKKELEQSLKIDIEKNPELFCQHLSLATKELLKITGGELVEDVLSKIFSNFCVGK